MNEPLPTIVGYLDNTAKHCPLVQKQSQTPKPKQLRRCSRAVSVLSTCKNQCLPSPLLHMLRFWVVRARGKGQQRGRVLSAASGAPGLRIKKEEWRCSKVYIKKKCLEPFRSQQSSEQEAGLSSFLKEWKKAHVNIPPCLAFHKALLNHWGSSSDLQQNQN